VTVLADDKETRGHARAPARDAEFVHATRAEGLCDGPQLTMSDAASTLGPRVTVRCVTCNHSRSIQEAAGSDGWQKLPVCRGRHPHLQRFYQCGKQLKLIVLGASNLWFAVSASALHLPQGQTVEDLVAAHWEILGVQPSAAVAQLIIDGMDALRGLRGHPIEEVWGCVEKLRGQGGPTVPESPDNLRDAEWQLLSRPTTERWRRAVQPYPQPEFAVGGHENCCRAPLETRLATDRGQIRPSSGRLCSQ
jgi:hypothetical protein